MTEGFAGAVIPIRAASAKLDFEQSVRLNEALVFSMAYASLRDRALAEELAQDVFLELYRKLADLESPAHVTNWLRRVTAHRLIDQARLRQRKPQTSLEDVAEPSSTPVEQDPWLGEILREMVATLSEPARMIVIMRYQEDMDPQDIAVALDIPVGTVKSSLHRALARLREKLGRRCGEINL
jgi:RNA polymerase sigma-70 factor (ECF subfamily)